ncbi:MAG: ribose 5-phosphate isomerase B [Planctomycetota bacterium]|jgi:ribose 5-phosphate isomerase B
MKIYLATDHAGYEMKEAIKSWLLERNYEVEDFGAFEYDPTDDYPDFIIPAAYAVHHNPDTSRAIILGGSGAGEAIAANRFHNVRAMVYNSPNLELVKLGREHNNTNVLSLGARFIDNRHAFEAIELWLETEYLTESRHERRLQEVNHMVVGICADGS